MHRLLAQRRCALTVLRSLNTSKDVTFDPSPSFYVLPEIASDQGSSELFSVSSVTHIKNISPEDTFNGFSKLLLDFQLAISKLSESVCKRDSVATFDTFVTPLEEILYPIEHALQLLQAVPSYNTDTIWSLIITRLHQKLKQVYKDSFCLDPDIYRALLNVKVNDKSAKTSELEMLNALIASCWIEGANLNGDRHVQVALPGKTKGGSLIRLRDLQSQLEHEQETFQVMVMTSSSVAGPQLSHSRTTGRMPNPSDLFTMMITGSAQWPVAESDLAPSAPAWLPAVFGGYQNGGHIAGMRVNLASDAAVRCLLQHCSTRQVRETVWSSWVKRASTQEFGGSTGQHAGNNNRIQQIRRLRANIAQQLDCPDWLAVLWKGSPYQISPVSADVLVEEVLEPLRCKIKPVGKSEFGLLSEWASSNLELRGSKLEAWDMDYAIEQYNFAAGARSPLPKVIRQADVEHLPPPPLAPVSASSPPALTVVMACLHHLASLFQLRLAPMDPGHSLACALTSDGGGGDVASGDQPVAFRVEDQRDGAFLGEFALDLFRRPGHPALFGSAVPIPLTTRTHLADDGVTIRPALGQHSSLLLMANLDPCSSGETPEEVALKDLLSIASGFGSCLQHILPRDHHHIIGSSSFLATDAGYLVGDVCASLLLATLGGHSAPKGTGAGVKRKPEAAPVEDASGQVGRYYTDSASGLAPPVGRISSLPLLHQLYKARFSLSLWSHRDRNRHWETLSDCHWTSHLPYAQHPLDHWPCSSLDLFGTSSAKCTGLQYQHVWRQVVLHDVLAALTEAGWSAEGSRRSAAQTAAVQEVLLRFRDTIMSSRDRLPPAELFRRFRGRDPLPDFIIKACELNSSFTDTSPPVLSEPAVTPVFIPR